MICLQRNQNGYVTVVTCDFNCHSETEGLLKVMGSQSQTL